MDIDVNGVILQAGIFFLQGIQEPGCILWAEATRGKEERTRADIVKFFSSLDILSCIGSESDEKTSEAMEAQDHCRDVAISCQGSGHRGIAARRPCTL